MKIKLFLIAIGSTLALSTVAIAQEHQDQFEQDQAQYQKQQTEQHNQVQLGHEAIRKFVDTMHDINSISGEYTARMEGVDSPEEARQIQSEAQNKMLEALEKNDITLEEYNGIKEIAQDDPELMEQIMSLYEERLLRG